MFICNMFAEIQEEKSEKYRIFETECLKILVSVSIREHI